LLFLHQDVFRPAQDAPLVFSKLRRSACGKERPVQKTVTRLVSDGRSYSPAGRCRVLFLQGPGYQDGLDRAGGIENRTTEVVRAEIFAPERGFEFFFDETFDPYWRGFGGQERLSFERFQTNLVYFAEIIEI
jgi:hypothetical protein